MKKIAVFFPGVGYHNDKPLLYYSRKLASEAGYDNCINVSYTSNASKIRGDKKKMKKTFEELYQQAEKQLQEVEWGTYDDILFVGKSIGTVISVAYAVKHQIENARQILYTPLEKTFSILGKVEKESEWAVSFIGTKDPWSDVSKVIDTSNKFGIPMFVYEEANHSLETDDTLRNIEIIRDVMEKSRRFM